MRNSLYDFILILAMLLASIILFLLGGEFVNLPHWIVVAVLIAVCAVLTYAIVWLATLRIDVKRLIHFAGEVRQRKFYSEAHLARSDEIKDLYNELYRMKEELRVLNEAKEELLQSVTHNLKLPISIIYLTAECMKDGLYAEGTPEAACEKIMEMSNDLSSQIETLMAINKNQYLIKTGGVNHSFCDVKPIIEQQLFEAEDLLNKYHIECRLKLYPVQFAGEYAQWQCVVQNLLENAMRYAQHYIEFKLYKTSLTVFNDGLHIDEEIIDTIFEPYIFGEKGHSGLGLALVKSLVNLNGFVIEAKNLDKGVQFKISKPK